MNHYIKHFLIMLLFISSSGHSAPMLGNNSYWECISQDKVHSSWVGRNGYQKTALNIAYSACKKESTVPQTCKFSKTNCEAFNQGRSTRRMWRCTALDHEAIPWRSALSTQRDEAALGAKDYCKQRSDYPETCYINFITCLTISEED